MKKLTFKVTGMKCKMCVAHVDKAVKDLNGVSDVEVNLDLGLVNLSAEDTVNEHDIVKAIEEAGYQALLA